MIPVLLLVYNRPDHTKKVLDQLIRCGINAIYVSGDGPKNGRDKISCDQVRTCIEESRIELIASQFQTKNIGCKNAVISGISWFFEQVENGIILEDDCLPSSAFFPFCEELLTKYEDVKEVAMISGNNPLGTWETDHSHHFSRIGHIWGWATWRDRWKAFNPKLPAFNSFVENKGFERLFGPTSLAKTRKDLTEKSLLGEIDTWDYQWVTHMNMLNALAAIPSVNLVKNLGLDDSGTNTESGSQWIANSFSEEPLAIDNPPVVHDSEYEMEVHLCNLSNQPGTASSTRFWNLGRKAASKGPLKILQINSTDAGGGAEWIALQLHRKLLELGHESSLLVEVKKTNEAGIDALRGDLRNTIDKLKPDVIHIHNLHGTSIPLETACSLSLKTPTLITLHDSWLTTGSVHHPFEVDTDSISFIDRRRWNNELNNRKTLLGQSNIRFTSPSQWMRDRSHHFHAIRPFLVHNATDMKELQAIEIPSERYVLFVANKPQTNPYKDFKTLKQAWQLANERLGELAVDLIIMGGENSEEKIGERSIYSIVSQTHANVGSFMAKALLVIQASTQDNAPLTILEAHAQNAPVIGSLVGGIPEMLSTSERELLYESSNASDLATKIYKAIENLDSLNDDAHSYWKNVSKNHDLTAMAETYLGHYIEMTHG